MAKTANPPVPFRTLDARPDEQSLIKPGELIDVVEMAPLTFTDRRIYNQLLDHSWDMIDKPVEHVIAKKELRGSHNANDRVGESIERLMGAIVKVRVTRNDRTEIQRVQLLGGNSEQETPDGMVRYEFPPALRKILKNSTVFARLQKEVMFALSSKYSLALYEMLQKRGNLKWKSHEDLPLTDFREFLGVPKGKLMLWADLRRYAIEPAVTEVNGLSDYQVEITPQKQGRKITSVRMTWWRKDHQALDTVMYELDQPRVGRKARINGTAETVSVPTQITDQGTAGSLLLRSETFERAREEFPGWDIYYLENEWRNWMVGKKPSRNVDDMFLRFCQTHTEANPLQ